VRQIRYGKSAAFDRCRVRVSSFFAFQIDILMCIIGISDAPILIMRAFHFTFSDAFHCYLMRLFFFCARRGARCARAMPRARLLLMLAGRHGALCARLRRCVPDNAFRCSCSKMIFMPLSSDVISFYMPARSFMSISIRCHILALCAFIDFTTEYRCFSFFLLLFLRRENIDMPILSFLLSFFTRA